MTHALIVEDRLDTREWLASILEQACPGLTHKTAGSLRAARAIASRHAWQIALIDLGLPDGSGTDLIRELHAAQPEAHIVVTTIYDDDSNLFNAIAAGAQGYLLKAQPAEQLVQQLKLMQNGTPPLSPSIAHRMLEHFRQRAHDGLPREGDTCLSPRDTEILSCIGRGLKVSETAQHLGLTPNTVASYIKQLYRKLDINTRAEAALEASRRGLI